MTFANEIWLAIRSDVPDGSGDGSPGNPYAVNSANSFASIMRDPHKAGQPNITIRLTPGIYRTRGSGGGGLVLPAGTEWFALPGQRIIGSGILSTTLRYVSDPVPIGDPGQNGTMIQASSSDYLTSFQLSDLTVDCGLQSTPFDPAVPLDGGATRAAILSGSNQVTISGGSFLFDPTMLNKVIKLVDLIQKPDGTFFVKAAQIVSVDSSTQVTLDRINDTIYDESGLLFWVYKPKMSVTALSVVGDNILIKRVRVINFGTRTPYYFDGIAQPDPPSPNRTYEAFPLRAGGRTSNTPSFNVRVEDCIFEQPYPSSAREVSCFVMGSGIDSSVRAPGKLHLQPLGNVLRNCYFNLDYVNPSSGPQMPIVSITKSGSGPYTITVNTVYPHDLLVGDYVEMSGNTPSGYNGRFQVVTVSSTDGTSRQFTFTNTGTDPRKGSNYNNLTRDSAICFGGLVSPLPNM